MTIHEDRSAATAQTHSAAALTDGELATLEARAKLARLMPFHRWCAALDPTEAAKELYLFVRARLKMRATEALRMASSTARVRVKRARASKARSAAAIKDPAPEQRLG